MCNCGVAEAVHRKLLPQCPQRKLTSAIRKAGQSRFRRPRLSLATSHYKDMGPVEGPAGVSQPKVPRGWREEHAVGCYPSGVGKSGGQKQQMWAPTLRLTSWWKRGHMHALAFPIFPNSLWTVRIWKKEDKWACDPTTTKSYYHLKQKFKSRVMIQHSETIRSW